VPEGHTVRRQAREHDKLFRGHRLHVSSPQGRFAEGAALLDGRTLEGTDAYGKHLWLRFAGDLLLHVHLGLYGTWLFGPEPAPAPVGALRVRLEGGGAFADLRGATACEVHTPGDRRAVVARLGPDPLRPRHDPAKAFARVTRSRSPVGLLLMDQTVAAGVGNVYRAEVLYRAGIDPHRPGRLVTRDEWDALWADLVTLMRAGVRTGRIVTTRPQDRDRVSGRARREDSHYVYRRTGLPCRVCGTPVAHEVMGARNLFWCPRCQHG
jgi:DNA-formamidopyrimidine glycosylase